MPVTVSPIVSPISRELSALRPASLFTSWATTANPRPCSPARAASMLAFSDRRLVWSARSRIVAEIRSIRSDLSRMAPMAAEDSATFRSLSSAWLQGLRRALGLRAAVGEHAFEQGGERRDAPSAPLGRGALRAARRADALDALRDRTGEGRDLAAQAVAAAHRAADAVHGADELPAARGEALGGRARGVEQRPHGRGGLLGTAALPLEGVQRGAGASRGDPQEAEERGEEQQARRLGGEAHVAGAEGERRVAREGHPADGDRENEQQHVARHRQRPEQRHHAAVEPQAAQQPEEEVDREGGRLLHGSSRSRCSGRARRRSGSRR